MPALSDILRFAGGQLFETPRLPNIDFIGLGFECAKQVAQLGASTIVLGCRNVIAGQEAKQRITTLQSTSKPPTVHVWHIDLEDYASVKAFAKQMRQDLVRRDALVANAGISRNRYYLAEGLERSLTINVVSTFLLSMLSLPLLRHTSETYKMQTHLTIVGSNVHCFADHAQLQACRSGQRLQELSDEEKADMAARYFLSKLVVILCARKLATTSTRMNHSSQDQRTAVIVNCPSPGWCKMAWCRQDDGGFWGRNMLRLIGRSPEVGARTLTSAIVAGSDTHGQYVSECRVKPASVFVRSRQGERLQREIWAELVDIIRGISPEAASECDEQGR